METARRGGPWTPDPPGPGPIRGSDGGVLPIARRLFKQPAVRTGALLVVVSGSPGLGLMSSAPI